MIIGVYSKAFSSDLDCDRTSYFRNHARFHKVHVSGYEKIKGRQSCVEKNCNDNTYKINTTFNT